MASTTSSSEAVSQAFNLQKPITVLLFLDSR